MYCKVSFDIVVVEAHDHRFGYTDRFLRVNIFLNLKAKMYPTIVDKVLIFNYSIKPHFYAYNVYLALIQFFLKFWLKPKLILLKFHQLYAMKYSWPEFLAKKHTINRLNVMIAMFVSLSQEFF
jgi:hypothetical protein